LHHACGKDPDRSHDFVSELLKRYPEAARIRHNNGKLPLHHMQEHFIFYFGEENSTVENTTVDLIKTHSDELLQRDGENRFVLCELSKYACLFRQVWHTAGRLCTHAFICATPKSKQPLYHMSSNLHELVENFMECPLHWTKN